MKKGYKQSEKELQAVMAKLEELLALGIPRKFIVNIGRGRIQDAYVEHKEYTLKG